MERDIVDYFEKRLEALGTKAMVDCMCQWICVKLYDEIVKLHPVWAGDDDDQAVVKLVMAGLASDPSERQHHIRKNPRREGSAPPSAIPRSRSA